jgi:hypothetical protein
MVERMRASRLEDVALLRDAVCPTCSRPVDSQAPRCPSCGRDLKPLTGGKAGKEPVTAIDPAGIERAHLELGLFAAARARVQEAYTAGRVAEEAVAVAVARYGKTISADTASKIQAALNGLSDAQDLHAAAVKALGTLVGMSMGDPPEIENTLPDQGPPDTPEGAKKNMSRLADIANAAHGNRAETERAIAIWQAQLGAAGTRNTRADFKSALDDTLGKLHALADAYSAACKAIDFMASMQATAVDVDDVTGAGVDGVPAYLKNSTATSKSKLKGGSVTGTTPAQQLGAIGRSDEPIKTAAERWQEGATDRPDLR